MEKHHKIYWKKGLDITPEIFIASDNYHIAERNLLGRFSAFRLYGILPGRKFNIEKSIDNDNVYIKNLECLAITPNGYIINICQDMPFNKKLSFTEVAGEELYVVLTTNPYSIIPSENEENRVCPQYDIVLKRTQETINDGIPILKIYKNSAYWEIDNNYIPPSIALYAVDMLKQRYAEIKNEIDCIIEKLPENDAFYLQTMMLQLELNNYSLQESPQEFVLLLKKFCLSFQLYLKRTKNMDDMPVLKRFMEEDYNHLEIGDLLKLGFKCIVAVNQEIDEKPIIEEEIEEVEEIEEIPEI